MKIITISPVKRDGKDIEIGTALDLPPREANALIDAQAAKLLDKKAKLDEGGEGGGGDQ